MIRRIVPFGAVAIVASLLIVVPALGSSHEDAVRLHLGSDGVKFSYDDVTQTLSTARNGCQLTTASAGGPLIALSSTNGGTSQPGLASLSLGVKSSGSNANGTPCSQVDSTESLTLKAGSALAGRSFNAVRLDVEMTGDAIVNVDFFVGSSTTAAATATLQTGTNIDPEQTVSTTEDPYDTEAPYLVSTDTVNDADLTDACAAPNSSGPNNAGNDNCLWSIDPGVTFDRIRLSTTVGTVSLEGSGDFSNNTEHDSLFYLANATPVANDDTPTTDEDTSMTVDVLGNDTDADLDTLTVSSVDTTGTLGAVTNNGTDVTYDPNGQFESLGTGQSATDTFGYTIGDGNGGTDSATVTVTVTGVNDVPVGVVGNASTDEDESTTITVATDVDSTILDAECSTSEPEASYLDNGDGTVTYTPPSDFNGEDILTCTVTDDEGGTTTTSAQITVTVGAVNDDPVAVDDDAYADDADTSVTIDVLSNDTDVDFDTLTVSSVDTTGTLGEVTNNGTNVTYEPPADFTGSDTFDYTVSDGNGGIDTATVTVWELFECGETLSISQGTVSADYTRLFPEGETGCDDGKPYEVDLTNTLGGEGVDTVVFQPRPRSGTPVQDCSLTPEDCDDEFAAELTFAPRAETNPPTTGTLQYDPAVRPEGEPYVFRDMKWCEVDFDPFDGSTPRPAIGDILPANESWCIVSAEVRVYSPTQTLTTWTVYGIGDPAKRG